MTPITAALLAIDALERNQAIGSDLLATLCQAWGDDSHFLRCRRHSGFLTTSNAQRLAAIFALKAFIARTR